MSGRRRGPREEADPRPLTLGQRRTVWRADAPFTALDTLAGPGLRSVKGAIDAFATTSDIDDIIENTERFLAWLKNYPR